MLNLRPVLLVIGALLCVLALAMIIPAFADMMSLNDDWQVFVTASFLTAFTGISLILTNREKQKSHNLGLKQAFVLTTFTWIALVAFAALPFLLSELNISYTDAFFEAMSALTTTGATVMVGLDHMPPGILLWRSILQWLGGIGIIVMAMSILPILKIGGMQLFRAESSDKSEKVLPRVTQVSAAISIIYLLMTIVCGFALWIAGMEPFDAMCHAMTTISTGGFSNHDTSILYFDNAMIEAVMVAFMIISGIPFVLYIQFLRGRPEALWRDSQVHWFLSLLFLAVTAVTFWLINYEEYDVMEAFRMATFNVVSLMTTAGFASADYNEWGSFPITFMFLLAVVGGCTGSTTGGIKIFRFQVLFGTAKAQINQLVQPHGIFHPTLNGKPVSDAATNSVMSFFILFTLCFSVIAALLSFTGLDFITSMSAAASAMANLGPGFGDVVGPAGNYSTLSDFAKWLLTAGMLVGRLEVFTVLILFSPYFWRN